MGINKLNTLSKTELGEFLLEKQLLFETRDFIPDDPISIPHLFTKKGDIEIAGFLAATIAWGNRKSILKNANRLMERMDHSPLDFVLNFEKSDEIIRDYGSLEIIFASEWEASGRPNNLKEAIIKFHTIFFSQPHADRTRKHVANPAKGSAAKRLNMYLRWMVRSADRGVDLGIWDKIPTSVLSIPLDVHTSNVGRTLGLLQRKQNDWKSVEELDASLRSFDSIDPVKFDFALFGLGAIEGF